MNKKLSEIVQDNYKQRFKAGDASDNGTVRLMPADRAGTAVYSFIPMNDLDGLDCDRLCGFYPVCDGDEEEYREILLPLSLIQGENDTGTIGIMVESNLEHCVRGDQWNPEWLSGSAVWRSMGRLCKGVAQASRVGLNIDRLAKTELYAAANKSSICLDMTGAAVQAVQGVSAGPEQTARAFAGLLYDLLNGRREGAAATAEEIDTLPDMYPFSDQLKAMFKCALTDAEAPDLERWYTLLADCASEIDKRLGVLPDGQEENDPVLDIAEPEGVIISDTGCRWQIIDPEDRETAASRLFSVYRLPEENWQMYDPVFDRITPTARRSFRILALPVDGVRRVADQLVIYEEMIAGADRSWNTLVDLEKGFSAGLWLISLLLEDMKRAEELGIVMVRLDRRQLIDQPGARVVLCGENIRNDPNGKVFKAADAVEMLLGSKADHPLMAPELKRLLAANRLMPIEADRWISVLRYAAEHLHLCPGCGKAFMSGAACPDCGGAAVRFFLKNDLDVREEIELPADGTPICLSQLHAGMDDEVVMEIYIDPKTGFFKVRNTGSFEWIFRRGGKTESLQPGQSTYLTAGMKIALIVHRLQLEYKGLEP